MDILRRKLLRNKGKDVGIKACWCMPAIPAIGRLNKEDPELRLARAT
jgi:hypothetical protein